MEDGGESVNSTVRCHTRNAEVAFKGDILVSWVYKSWGAASRKTFTMLNWWLIYQAIVSTRRSNTGKRLVVSKQCHYQFSLLCQAGSRRESTAPGETSRFFNTEVFIHAGILVDHRIGISTRDLTSHEAYGIQIRTRVRWGQYVIQVQYSHVKMWCCCYRRAS